MLPSGKLVCKNCNKSLAPKEIKVDFDFCEGRYEHEYLTTDIILTCPHCNKSQEFSNQHIEFKPRNE